MPVDQKLIVQCKSLLEGDLALSKCSVACTACGRCAADAEPGLIEMKNNLAVVNYSLNHLASKEVIRRCPTNAIVWVDWQQFDRQVQEFLPTGRVEKYREHV
jgi:Fe-S-cluster-containing hydrogenase component 2